MPVIVQAKVLENDAAWERGILKKKSHWNSWSWTGRIINTGDQPHQHTAHYDNDDGYKYYSPEFIAQEENERSRYPESHPPPGHHGPPAV